MTLSKKNLVVIVSDTLRKDHLGCYGNNWIRTPNLDKLAEKSTVLDNHYCASFPTVPNRADLYTGKWTFTYLGWSPMPVEEVILPDILKKAGYTTVAAVDTPFYVRWGYNYDRGFDIFVEIYGQFFRAEKAHEYVTRERIHEEDYFAPQTFKTAEHLLEQCYERAEPFFFLIDTWDPHELWDPPKWYAKLYKPDYDGRVIGPVYKRLEECDVTEEELEVAHACYCGEITMVDEWAGRFLRKLENMQLMDDTIIIFTSDHGYYFGEHGIFGKGIQKLVSPEKVAWTRSPLMSWVRSPLYEEIVRIPLMVYHPDEEPKRFNGLTSAVDLMPTLLDLVEVQKPNTIQGKSMIGAIRGDEDFKGRDFVVSSFPLYNVGGRTKIVDATERQVSEFLPSTITTRNWSLLYAAEGEDSELYNLKEDPNQRENVIEDHFDIAEELHKNFLKVLESSRVDQRLLEPRRKISLKTKKIEK